MSEMLFHADSGLHNELKNREDLVLFVGSGSSPEGKQLVVFAKYNTINIPSGSGCCWGGMGIFR